MSNPSRRAALHVIPTWLLVLLSLIGLVGVLLVGGDPAQATEFVSASVDAGGAPLAAAGFTLLALTSLALFVAIAALVVVLALEVRRRRDHVEG